MLVSLYEEPNPPANAIDYVKKYLGAPVGKYIFKIYHRLGVDIDELRAENAELRQVNQELQRRVRELTQELEQIRAEEEV